MVGRMATYTNKRQVIGMDARDKYYDALALAESNYISRLTEARRLMGEASEIYEEDKRKAAEEYRKARQEHK